MVAIAKLTLSSAGVAQDVTWTYDHKKECPRTQAGQPLPDGCAKQRTLRVKPGERILFEIANTYASGFDYQIRGYVQERSDEVKRQALEEGKIPEALDTVRVITIHASRYGGYILTITPKTDPGKLPVGAATLVLAVDAEKKPYAFSGGMSLTNVRSEAFVIRREFDSIFTAGALTRVDTVNRVREDPERRHAATVGFATFASVNLPLLIKKHSLEWINLVAGIGLETGGDTQYYFGGGFELHPGIFLNLGYTLGRVNTLPSGLSIGDAVSDANALNNLGRRGDSGVFLGLSFTFLGGGQAAFGKPFAGTKEGS